MMKSKHTTRLLSVPHRQQQYLHKTLVLELVTTIAVISVCIGFIVQQVSTIKAKANLAEIFSGFSGERIALVESFAIKGDSIQSELFKRVNTSEEYREASIEDVISNPEYNPRISTSTEKSSAKKVNIGDIKATRQVGRDRSGNTYKYTYNNTDGIFVAKGILGESNFFLTIRPSVTQNQVPWNIIWRCGWKEPPLGWVTPDGQSGSNLRNEYLFSHCRNTTGHQ